MDTLDNANTTTNPFANSNNPDILSQKEGFVLNLADGFKQNGTEKSPTSDFLGRPTNGKRSADEFDDDDDLGPETDVDAVDDVLLSPAIAAAKSLAEGIVNNNPTNLFDPFCDNKEEKATLETDSELQKQQTSEFDPVKSPREETPTPPADSVHDASGLVDNVAESGEDSDDEWNYFKGDTAQKENIPPSQTDKEVCELTDADLESDTMSQLNPNAAEFVPVSPKRNTASPFQTLIDDSVIAQSPRRITNNDIDINVPNPQDFESEIKSRPSDVRECANGDEGDNLQKLSSQELMENLLNGKSIEEIEFQPNSTPTKHKADEFHFGPNATPFSTPAKLLDQSEALSTKAVFGDESTASYLEGKGFDDSSFSGEINESQTFTKEQDPMSMSFYQDKDDETNPFDLNKVQVLPENIDDFLDKQQNNSGAILNDTISDLPEHNPSEEFGKLGNDVNQIVDVEIKETVETTEREVVSPMVDNLVAVTDTIPSPLQSPLPASQSPLPVLESPVPPSKSPLPGAQSPLSGVQSPMFGDQTSLSPAQSPLPLAQSPLLDAKSPVCELKSPRSGSQSPMPAMECQRSGSVSPFPTADSPLPTADSPLPMADSPLPTSQSPMPEAQPLLLSRSPIPPSRSPFPQSQFTLPPAECISPSKSSPSPVPPSQSPIPPLSPFEAVTTPQLPAAQSPIPPQSPLQELESPAEDVTSSVKDSPVLAASPIENKVVEELEMSDVLADSCAINYAQELSSAMQETISSVSSFEKVPDDMLIPEACLVSTPKSTLSEQVDLESVTTADVNSFLERSSVPDVESPLSPSGDEARLIEAFTSELGANKIEDFCFIPSNVDTTQIETVSQIQTSGIDVDVKSEIIAPEFPVQIITTPSEESKAEDIIVQNEAAVVAPVTPQETKEPIAEIAAVAAVAATAVAATAAATTQKKTPIAKPKPGAPTAAKKTPSKPATSPTKTTAAAKPSATKTSIGRTTTITATSKLNQTSKTSLGSTTLKSTVTKASPKPKMTPTTAAAKAPEKKPLTNGDIKPAIAKRAPITAASKTTTKSVPNKLSPTKTDSKTTLGTAKPATTLKSTTLRQTASARPTTLLKSNTTSSATKTSTVTATKSTLVKTTTLTSPKSTTNAAPKPRPATAPTRARPLTSRPTPKSADTEKQIKETANKQITASRTSSTTSRTVGSAGKTMTTTVRKTELKTPGTRMTLTKTTTSTLKMTDVKKPAELIRHPNKTKTGVTKKTKVEQNGITPEVNNTITISPTNLEPQLVKDVSPVIEHVVFDNSQISEINNVTD